MEKFCLQEKDGTVNLSLSIFSSKRKRKKIQKHYSQPLHKCYCNKKTYGSFAQVGLQDQALQYEEDTESELGHRDIAQMKRRLKQIKAKQALAHSGK